MLMSTSLAVRYSDVMQAERDFNNLARSSTTSSDYNDSTLSVKDARKRFEQISSSTAVAPSNNKKKSDGASSTAASKLRPAPPPPYKNRLSEPNIRSQSTGAASKSRVQRSSNQSAIGANNAVEEATATSTAQDVGGFKAKGLKKSLKKAHSIQPLDLTSTGSEVNSSNSSCKSPTTSKTKLFRKMSSDNKGLGKVDSGAAASNGNTKSSKTVKNGGGSQNSTPNSSPNHKKFSSPLSSKKKRPSASSSSSQSSIPGDKPTMRKSLSNKVLASSEERTVQASLREEDEGKVVGGSKPTTPRVIEDGALKLNLTEGKKEGGHGVWPGLLHVSALLCEIW